MPNIAFVTGAARGIGRGIALRLARDGFAVAINDIPLNRAALEKVQQEVEHIGRPSLALTGDVSKEEDVKAMVDRVAEQLGSLDVMVANAGLCVTKPFLLTTAEDVQRINTVNGLGTFLCYKYAAQQMIKQGKGGRIVGASSLAGKQGWPFLSAYSMSKFAVRGLTQTAASELKPYGITVNAYAPGPVDTPMLTELKRSVDEHMGEAAAKGQEGSDGSVDDVAALVSYFASPESSLLTGQTVSINGGQYFD